MEIKVLGTGCPKCKALERFTRIAASETGISADIEKVEDIYKIMALGVMQTPALVINQKVVLSGRLPTVAEIKEILLKNK